jgi:hypothetical protein
MNWKKFILLSCVLPCVFAVSTATAQMMTRRTSTARMPMHRTPMLGLTAPMPMHRTPMLNSASGFLRFDRFNDRGFDRNDRFRRFHRFNEIIIFDDFGFPLFPFFLFPPFAPAPLPPFAPF